MAVAQGFKGLVGQTPEIADRLAFKFADTLIFNAYIMRVNLIIYIIMEVLAYIEMWGSVGEHRFFADPVPFAGPIGSPMMGFK